MINIRSINKLGNDDGITLRRGRIVRYKTGWQVATEGVEVTTAREAIQAVKRYNGNCGVWYNEGIYYVDKCRRITTKREALAIGAAHNQLSIYGWKSGKLAWL